MKRIILDTNFLLIPAQFRVDIFSEIGRICDFEYELCVVDGTMRELEKINNAASRVALQLVKSKGVKVIAAYGSVDSAIVMSADNNTLVATQDAALKRRLKGKAAGFIVLRQRQYLKLAC